MCLTVKIKSKSKVFSPLGLSTLLFVTFTLNPRFTSINFVRFLITRLADISLPTMIIQSSAYLTTFSPLCSISLSSSFSMMFARSGERLTPCGVPITDSLYSSSTIIPLTKNFLMIEITSPSLIVLPIRVISLSWFTVSKNFSKSMSTIQCK